MNALQSLLQGLKDLFTWWFTVAPWEQAIRVRLGKRVKVLYPGAHVRLPILDRLYLQSVRLRTADIPMLTVTTKDGHPVSVAGNLFYRITDVLKLYTTLHHAQEAVVDMAASAITGAIHEMRKEDCTIKAVEEAATSGVDFKEYGINSTAIHLTDFAFVKTYRLIHDTKLSNWENRLDTITEVRNPVAL